MTRAKCCIRFAPSARSYEIPSRYVQKPARDPSSRRFDNIFRRPLSHDDASRDAYPLASTLSPTFAYFSSPFLSYYSLCYSFPGFNRMNM